MDIMEFHYIFINLKSWCLAKLFLNLKMWKTYPPICCIFASFGISWRHMEACFSQTSPLTKFLFSPIIKSFAFSYKLKNLIHTSLISAKSESQSVSEVFCNKDSESRRFQFDQSTYLRLSQSTIYHPFQTITPPPPHTS